MKSIEEILKEKIELFKKKDFSDIQKEASLDYNKKWAFAVQCFQKRLNKDQTRFKKPPYDFMTVRQRLVGIQDIADMRWFYRTCEEYRFKKKGNTFGKCFWGATKVK